MPKLREPTHKELERALQRSMGISVEELLGSAQQAYTTDSYYAQAIARAGHNLQAMRTRPKRTYKKKEAPHDHD